MKNHVSNSWGLTLIHLFLLIQVGNGQDVVFSNFQASPLIGNPAHLSSLSDIRLGMHFRNQALPGGQQFSTGVLSFAYPFFHPQTGKHLANLGAYVFHERESTILQTSGFALGAGGHLYSQGGHHVHLGFQSGFFMRSINAENIITDNQIAGGVLNESPSDEIFANQSVSYLSISSGLRWVFDPTGDREKYHMGLAWNNINQPGLSFFDDANVRMPSHWVLSGSALVLDQYRLGVGPEVRWIFRNGENFYFIGGLLDYSLLSASRWIKPGRLKTRLWYYSNGSIGMGLQFDQPRYQVGFSYDLPVGEQAGLWTGNGTWEINLGIKFPKKKKSEIQDPVSDSLWVQLEKVDSLTMPDPMLAQNPDFDKPDQNIMGTLRERDTTISSLIRRKEALIRDTIFLEALPRHPLQLKPEEKEIFHVNIQFNLQQDKFDEGYEELLHNIVDIMQRKPNVKLLVTGHTCDLGGVWLNKRLSLERANSVKKFLVDRGLPAERIFTKGDAYNSPLVPNINEDNRKINRRVEFTIFY